MNTRIHHVLGIKDQVVICHLIERSGCFLHAKMIALVPLMSGGPSFTGKAKHGIGSC